jgi:hypothetical protein
VSLSSRGFEPKAFYDLAAYIRDKLTYMLPRRARKPRLSLLNATLASK